MCNSANPFEFDFSLKFENELLVSITCILSYDNDSNASYCLSVLFDDIRFLNICIWSVKGLWNTAIL